MVQLNRTNKTNLSNDELVLFDALFDGDCSFSMLTQSEIREHGQLPYTHSLDDKALQALLNDLVTRKLLRTFVYAYAEDIDDLDYYGLTEQGGALWELERQPNWERYIYTRQFNENGSLVWSIESASLDAAKGYMEVARAAGLGTPENLTLVRKPDYQFLPWKKFPLVFELYGEATGDLTGSYPLKWWRNIPELLQQ